MKKPPTKKKKEPRFNATDAIGWMLRGAITGLIDYVMLHQMVGPSKIDAEFVTPQKIKARTPHRLKLVDPREKRQHKKGKK